MEDLPDASTQLHSTLKFYVDEFRRHQESVKAHLKGNSCDEPPLLPAFLPPSSYWTSAEKDLFFHALSVYSRLQPELIAQHVKTKSTFDVCVYLEVLKRAAELIEEDEEEDSTENSLRAEMEPAMEVSEKWVLREENIAESLMALDACPHSLEGSNTKLAHKCTCPSTSERYSPELVDDYPMPQKCLNNNNLNHLDPTCLMVLEMIHREGEAENYPDDAHSLAEERQRSNSVFDLQAIPQGENHGPSEPVELSSNADQQMPMSSSRNPSPGPDKAQLRRIQKRIYMRRKRAEAVGKTANTEAVKLRPGRPERDRKPPKPRSKTYMPRKASGRGRKRLSRMDASQNGSEKDELESEDARSPAPSRRSPSLQQETSGEKDEQRYEMRTKGGLTRPYKLKKLFHESGITTQTLSKMGLDIFNLKELGRLLRLNDSLNAPLRQGGAISISVECIQLLREMIKAFSCKVVQCAIIMKEQEIRLKANLKVWRYDRQEVSVENMLECLKMLGLDQLSKERYFSNMVDGDDDEGPPEEMPVDEESSVSDERSVCESEEDASASESLQPLSILTDCDLLSEGDILTSDVDEAALTKELAEEDILDVLDIVRAHGYEKSLWQTHH